MSSMRDARKPRVLGQGVGCSTASVLTLVSTLLTSIPRNLHRSGKTIHDSLLSSKNHELLHSFCSPENQSGGRGKCSVSLAPTGVGQAAKLCPPTSSLVSTGEHSLPKQTLRGWDRSCQCSKSRRSSRAKPMEAQSSFLSPERSLSVSPEKTH